MAAVTLAYLPDVVEQLRVIPGWSNARLLGHYVLFAAVVSPAIAAMLTRLATASFPRAVVTSLVSLLVHDALGSARAADRALVAAILSI